MIDTIYNQKIAIVYDWIDKWGGVERVLLTLHTMFPEADFYTSYYNSEKATWAKDLNIKTSFIQRLPPFINSSRLRSIPFYPYAFESFDFSYYDLVISVTSSFAKSVITKPDTRHICYLLTPTRFLWSHEDEYFQNKTIKSLLAPYISQLKKWDFVAAQRPDTIFSISQGVADRCKKYYRRDSKVLHPGFDMEYWRNIKTEIRNPKFEINLKSELLSLKRKKYFLIVSRLEPYKKVELVIRSINQLKQNLIIVGEGSELKRLKELAGHNVSFFFRLTDQELGYVYSQAEALVMPQEEDFGYVSLEAQFFGCPVIAYKRGGAVETVLERKTGLFFNEQSVQSFQKALKLFDMVKYDLQRYISDFGQKSTARFSKNKFDTAFKNLI